MTDNGSSFNKDNVTISSANGKYTFSAKDAYGNSSTFVCTIIVDNEEPTITLNKNRSTLLSISDKLTEKTAKERITVKDNYSKLSNKDINVKLSTNDWAYNIIYSVKDEAGNTATLEETVPDRKSVV